MYRWSIQRLKETSDKIFTICILQERLNRLSNPYSPLATKLKDTIRMLNEKDGIEKDGIEKDGIEKDGIEKKVYCERCCIHQSDGICQNEAIAISNEGFCCNYEKKEDE